MFVYVCRFTEERIYLYKSTGKITRAVSTVENKYISIQRERERGLTHDMKQDSGVVCG